MSAFLHAVLKNNHDILVEICQKRWKYAIAEQDFLLYGDLGILWIEEW